MEKISFGDLRQVLSRVDRLSIFDKETLEYNNFETIQDVPASYDAFIVCGIGTTISDFHRKETGVEYLSCIEILTVKEKN